MKNWTYRDWVNFIGLLGMIVSTLGIAAAVWVAGHACFAVAFEGAAVVAICCLLDMSSRSVQEERERRARLSQAGQHGG